MTLPKRPFSSGISLAGVPIRVLFRHLETGGTIAMKTFRAENTVPRLIPAISLFLLAVSGLLLGDEPLMLDLGLQHPGEIHRVPTDPNAKALVEVRNRLPSKLYDVTVKRSRVSIPPLDQPKRSDRILTGDCKAIADANEKLFLETEEALVSLRQNTLVSALAAAPAQDCGGERLDAAKLLVKVTVVVGSLDVRHGDEVEIRVERAGEKGPLVWRKIYSTGPPGAWLTSYGFNFIPSQDKRYFLEPAAETGSFRIRRDAERREMDFAPSIYFSWMPANQRRQVRFSPTAGLGFDLSTPIVFAGLSILYNWNIGIFLGAVMHQQTRLRGEFREGDTIRQNLTPDNLVEKTYAANVAAGIKFRFGSNPFPTRPPPEMKDPPTATPTPGPTPPR